MTEAQERQLVCDITGTWRKTPWHHKARLKGEGVDCVQMLIAVYAAAGKFEEFDPGDYPIDCMLHADVALQSWCERLGRRTDNPQPGDTVLWKFGRCYSHAGIVIKWPTAVIHAFRPFGEVCETPADASRLAGRSTIFYTFW